MHLRFHRLMPVVPLLPVMLAKSSAQTQEILRTRLRRFPCKDLQRKLRKTCPFQSDRFVAMRSLRHVAQSQKKDMRSLKRKQHMISGEAYDRSIVLSDEPLMALKIR